MCNKHTHFHLFGGGCVLTRKHWFLLSGRTAQATHKDDDAHHNYDKNK